MKNISKFNEAVLKEYKRNIKAIWISNKNYCVLIDNLALVFDKKEFELYVARLKEKYGINLKLKTFELTDMFKKVMSNDIKLLNEIKDASAVYDPSAFLTPLKSMLEKGNIVGTEDSVVKIFDSAKERFKAVEGYKKQILYNSYKAVVDAGYAALIARDYSTPVPTELPGFLRKYFVKKKILERVYVSVCEDIIKKYKAFEHGKLRNISGKELGELHNAAIAFVDRMKTLVGKGFVESDVKI